jgi:hypothetical protein
MIGRRLGFREKIVVLIAVPLAALLLAGVPLLAAQAQAQRDAVADLDTMRTATALQPLLSALTAERALTLASVAVPPAPGALAEAQVRSRAAVPAVLQDLGDRPRPGSSRRSPGSVRSTASGRPRGTGGSTRTTSSAISAPPCAPSPTPPEPAGPTWCAPPSGSPPSTPRCSGPPSTPTGPSTRPGSWRTRAPPPTCSARS